MNRIVNIFAPICIILAVAVPVAAAAQVMIEGDVVTAYDDQGNYYSGRVDSGIITLYDAQDGTAYSGIVDPMLPATNLYGDTGGTITIYPETGAVTVEGE